MFGLNVHDTLMVERVRVHASPENSPEGWITIEVRTKAVSWDKDSPTMLSDITLHFRDLDIGIITLRDELTKGIEKWRKENAEEWNQVAKDRGL